MTLTYFKSRGTALLAAAFALCSIPTFAQAPPPPADSPLAAQGDAKPVYSAQFVLDKIGKAIGVTAVADSNVGGVRVALPAEPTTRENFSQQLADVVKQLPAGTASALLYLPAPRGGLWRGDDLAAFAAAQTRLYGSSTGSPAGAVEILGQPIPAAQAQNYIAGLRLQPVYLVSNPQAAASAGRRRGVMSDTAQTNLTPQQQTDQQIQRQQRDFFRQMTPQQRQEYRQMTPQQRQQIRQQMGGGGKRPR